MTDSEYDREKLQERLAKLAGGVAQINVRRRDRNRDEGAQGPARRRPGAPRRRRIEEGIVPGGGVALIRCSKALDKLDLEGDEAARRRRSSATCSTMPLRLIAENAGLDGAVVVNQRPAS